MEKMLPRDAKAPGPARTADEAVRRLEKAGFRVAEPSTKRLPEPLKIKGLSRSLRDVRR